MNAKPAGTVNVTDDLHDIVNLARYPINDLDSPVGKQLVAQCKRQFTDSVSCLLPQFLRAETVQSVVNVLEAKEKKAHFSERHRSPYGVYNPLHKEGVSVAENERHHVPQRRSVYYLAYDEFDEHSVIRRLYRSPLMTRFVAQVMECEEIFPAEDPLMSALVSLYYEGSELGWHCDTQEFTITVMFRPARSGGEFQYFPYAGPRDKNFDRVPDVLAGDHSGVRTVPLEAGSILLFRGANTLHRVAKSRSSTPRLLSVFHYEQSPGRIYADEFKRNLFGRVK